MSMDVCKVLLEVIKTGYPSPTSYSWGQQGTEEQIKEQREAFLTAVNNTRTLTDNILKLAKGFEVRELVLGPLVSVYHPLFNISSFSGQV